MVKTNKTDNFLKIKDLMRVINETHLVKHPSVNDELVLHFYPYKPDDVDTVTMVFVQSCFDVTTGKFQLSYEDIEKLASKMEKVSIQKRKITDSKKGVINGRTKRQKWQNFKSGLEFCISERCCHKRRIRKNLRN